MTDEAGGNPNEIRGKARSAAQLADAMTGLQDTFEDIMEGAKKAAGEEECAEGYPKFLDKYRDDIRDVEEHGLQLAENIDAGGAEVGRTDAENEDEYEGAWPGLSRGINQSGGGGGQGRGGHEVM